MIRKEYMVQTSKADGSTQAIEQAKKELMDIIDKAFSEGAIAEVKIIEGIDLHDGSKRYSKLRFDIVSNTDFDKFC